MTDPTFDLYASPTPNALKILIALEEGGLAYRIKPVDIWKGQQFEDWFIALNPNSKVPVLVDPAGPDGMQHNVFESCAILLYLAEKTGKGLSREGAARSLVVQWLFFQAANLGPMAGQLNHFALYAPQGEDYARSRYITEVRRIYGVIDRTLGHTSFVGSDDFSIADMAIYPWIANLKHRNGEAFPFLSLGSDEFQSLAEWFSRCSERPSVKRAQSAFAGIRSTLASATPEERDRVFGRGAFSRAT
ncbi:glutathione S-transferase N-terminal domain-containing protein [Mesorhizobium sp. KR9-304]|uniref:glutathione S-transferase family protein n=1 Tax=Mesorhizobium sp. KR9-304 TaxID=3156614 RepID=UPI0032B61B5E